MTRLWSNTLYQGIVCCSFMLAVGYWSLGEMTGVEIALLVGFMSLFGHIEDIPEQPIDNTK